MNEEKQISTVPFNMYEARCYEYERLIEQQRKDLLEDKYKTVKHWKQACFVLVFLVILIISSIVGTGIYVLSNYEFATYDYAQDGGSLNNMNAGEQGDVTNGAEIEDNENNSQGQ